ncbi:MAG: 16S rRNA (cytidine(1402)-2'-O)-methyltransferase [Pseudomonadota bacterium]
MDKVPSLFVVATPIGNLGDMTFRAVETLKAADIIYCEDTRHTARLCTAYEITTPREPYHDHNGAQMRPAILDRLAAGQMIALVSDAGTPLVADPGFKLVRAAREAGHTVVPVPGACAAVTGLSAAGLPSDQFFFAGFLPPKTSARQKALAALGSVPGTLVFYETAPRVAASLRDMIQALGPREAVVARELTKRFEEMMSGDAASLADRLEAQPVKGELVILLGPATVTAPSAKAIDAFLLAALADHPVKEAAKRAAAHFDIPRQRAYQRALMLRSQMTDESEPDQ